MPIPEQILTPEAFLAAAEAGGVVLDVRAPGEFAAGHLPGAVSFPLFTDEERARVGTVYKQESKQAAVDLGLELVLSLIHISEPTRPLYISYAVFCLKKKK